MAVPLRVRLLAHLEMARPYTMFHAGLVALAGALVASRGRARPRTLGLVATSATLGWIAGLYAGDYYDRRIDAIAKPHRPVPSGRVSPAEALTTIGLYIGSGYLCSLALSVANLALAVGTTGLGIAYAKTFKEKALLGNFDRGLLGALAVLFGGLAAGREGTRDAATAEGDPRPAVILLALVVFFHDAATNLVGAIRDVEGDRAAGCPTVPVVYGLPRAVAIACGLALCAAALSLLLIWGQPKRPVAVALYGASLMVAARVYTRLWLDRETMTRSVALDAHKVLVIERLLLNGAIIGTEVSARRTLTLLAGVLAATTGAQWALRNRYEYGSVNAPEGSR